MINPTEQKVAAIIALAANYDKEFPEALFPIWLDLLANYTPVQVFAAVKDVIRTYEYKTLPPFAVLQKALDKICGRMAPEKLLRMQANAEWERVLAAVAEYGSYGSPNLHPTTAYVLRGMGGWEAACQWQVATLEWRRKEFVENWQLAHGHVDDMLDGALALENNDGPIAISQVLQALMAETLAQPDSDME